MRPDETDFLVQLRKMRNDAIILGIIQLCVTCREKPVRVDVGTIVYVRVNKSLYLRKLLLVNFLLAVICPHGDTTSFCKVVQQVVYSVQAIAADASCMPLVLLAEVLDDLMAPACLEVKVNVWVASLVLAKESTEVKAEVQAVNFSDAHSIGDK